MQRGVDELRTMLDKRWEDGRVPHIIFHDLSGDYFPGPDVYGTADRYNSSTISQPPVWATAARRLLEMGADKDSIRALIPGIVESHLWFKRDRDPLRMFTLALCILFRLRFACLLLASALCGHTALCAYPPTRMRVCTHLTLPYAVLPSHSRPSAY